MKTPASRSVLRGVIRWKGVGEGMGGVEIGALDKMANRHLLQASLAGTCTVSTG